MTSRQLRFAFEAFVNEFVHLVFILVAVRPTGHVNAVRILMKGIDFISIKIAIEEIGLDIGDSMSISTFYFC